MTRKSWLSIGKRIVFFYSLLLGSLSALANSTSIQLDANQAAIYQVKFLSGDLIAINQDTNNQLFTLRNQQTAITQELVVLGPFNRVTNVELSADSLMFEEIPKESLTAIDVELVNQVQPFIKAHKKPQEADFERLQEMLEIHSESSSVTSIIVDQIQISLGHLAINSANQQAMLKVLSRRNNQLTSWLLLQCRATNELAKRKVSLIEAIDVLGSILESLINLRKNQGEFSPNTINWRITQRVYQSQCLASVKSLTADVIGYRITKNQTLSLLNESEFIVNALLTVINETDAAWLKAKTLGHAWSYYNMLDQHKTAELLSNEAIAYQKRLTTNKVSATQLAYFYQNLGTSLLRQGRFVESHQAFSNGLNTGLKINQDREEILTYNKGYLYAELGAYEVSQRYIERALQRYKIASIDSADCKNYKVHWKVATYLTKLATVFRNQSKLELAEEAVTCALRMFNDQPSFFKFSALLEQAKIKYTKKNYQQSKSLAESLTNIKHIELPHMLGAMLVVASSHIKANEIGEAKAWLTKLAKVLFGQSQNSFTSLFDTEQYDVHSLEFVIEKIEFFTLLIELCDTSDVAACSSIFFDKAKAFIQFYKDKVTYPQAWNAARYSLVEAYIRSLLPSWHADPNQTIKTMLETLDDFYSVDLQLEKRNFSTTFSQPQNEYFRQTYQDWLNAERHIYHLSGDERKVAQLRADKLKNALYQLNLSQPETYHPVQSLNVAEIQSLLSENELLIRYLIGEDYSFALLVDKNLIKKFELPRKSNIVEALEQVGLSNGVSDWPKFIRNETLKKLIPTDYINSGKYEKLVIIPDSKLHRLPFSAINTSESPDIYMPAARKVEIVRTHSISNYVKENLTDSNEADKFESIAIFALDNPGSENLNSFEVGETRLRDRMSSLARIPGAIAEANFLNQLYFSDQSFIALGSNATTSFLLNKNTRNATILHIATHGLFNPLYPEEVGIVVAPERQFGAATFLTYNTLMSREFSSKLVVISGCDTMQGKLYKGSGLRSLTRGFLSQGAQSVLGTLWPVQDTATSQFMKVFYSNLKEHSNSSKALHLTKKQFATSGKFRHPKYWSGFVLTSKNRHSETFYFKQ